MPLPWETGSRLANPANSVLIHHYLKQTALEQRAANVQTRKAALIDDSIYHLLQSTLLHKWANHVVSANQIDALKTIRLAFLCAILWHTGLRLEDALRLLVQQIRPVSEKQLLVQINITKAERESQPYRTVLIVNDGTQFHPHRLFAILRDAYLGYGLNLLVDRLFTDLIFDPDGICTGTQASQARQLRDMFRSVCDELKLDKTVSFHSFHGSRAYRDAIAGIPPEVTCANIHWSLNMYNRYIKGRLPISSAARSTATPQPARPSHRRRAEIYGWEEEFSD
jgi:integrase